MEFHDLLILMRRGQLGTNEASNRPDLREDYFGPDHIGVVMDSYREVGHEITSKRAEQRFRNGQVFFRLTQDRETMALIWFVIGRPRYLDEVCWMFPLCHDQAWLRDGFISPRARGQGMFSELIYRLLQNDRLGIREVWSDTDWGNTSSRRAHQKAGFSSFARLRALAVSRHVILRGAPPAWHEPITEVEPSKRFLNLRGRNFELHLSRVA